MLSKVWFQMLVLLINAEAIRKSQPMTFSGVSPIRQFGILQRPALGPLSMSGWQKGI
jgi:hypothetical protein